MPRILQETEHDLEQDQVEAAMTAAEEQTERARFAEPAIPGGGREVDYTDGGYYGAAKLYPTQQGVPVKEGRACARRAWMWNGSETTMPLAWNPDGTRHDGARAYLAKRHCLCCATAGFRGRSCPRCSRSNCRKCQASRDMTKTWARENGEPVLVNGRPLLGWIIPVFYLRQADIPFPARLYGTIDCFLEMCPRRGALGFRTEQEMRMHARSRHRMEYQTHLEIQQAQRTDEIDSLRSKLDALILAQAKVSLSTVASPSSPAYPPASGSLPMAQRASQSTRGQTKEREERS